MPGAGVSHIDREANGWRITTTRGDVRARDVLLATNGYYKIGRMADGAWVNAPLDWTQSDAIVQGVSKPNTLRLTIKGQSLAVFINGKPGAVLRAQSPETSSLIGLYAESADKAGAQIADDVPEHVFSHEH